MITVRRTSLRPARILGKLYLIVSGSFSEQNFLGQRWIAKLVRKLPTRWRRAAALRLLGVSPHYFVQQWTDRYTGLTRRQTLEAEFEGKTMLTRADYGDEYNLGPASKSMELELYIEGIRK